ncbi:MAG: hypothetical protein CM15mP74_33260 [Halieaceae bacterium]|nr:MAG: hypothetical protein CM15mP74_33260 [Halieaceae bacterium]
MRAADAVSQLWPRLSLRGRLYLFSAAILILFAINVGTSLWGASRAMRVPRLSGGSNRRAVNRRTRAKPADQTSTGAGACHAERTTDEPLDEAALEQARADLEIISERLRQLGGFGGEELEAHYRRLHDSVTALLVEWRQFYEQYNADGAIIAVESARSYNSTQQRLQELDQRQSFVAVQRANAIDRTITLTDQITVIGFISSIAITLALVFAMIRSTNASLTRMKRE